MSNDYLWDGSGEPDPEIQKLESTLGKLRHSRPAPVFPEITASQTGWRSLWVNILWPRLIPTRIALAALLLLLAAGLFLLRSRHPVVAPSDWNVTDVQGAPQLGGSAIKSATANLGVGQVLETDSSSHASIRAESTGEIRMEPGTRLRVIGAGSQGQRLRLERGTIQAIIWAAPGEFVVDTPSAIAVDLGCSYRLTVDDSGNGLLRTSLGWVGFKLKDREAFIPAGAACATKKKSGPGTPYFEDASSPFRDALARLDEAGISDQERDATLQVVLSQARTRDALTLWHLLARVPESDRGRVYDRLAQLVPPPAGVTREGIMRLEPQMLDLWWNELGFGDASLWRHWERSWAQQQ